MNIFGAKDGVGSPTDVNNNFRFFPNDTFEVTITNIIFTNENNCFVLYIKCHFANTP